VLEMVRTKKPINLEEELSKMKERKRGLKEKHHSAAQSSP
jgi:hypothetical protein